MPNVYTNHKAKLANTSLTTIYTVPTAKTAIVKSIRVANEDTSNDCNIKATGLFPFRFLTVLIVSPIRQIFLTHL